MSSRPAASAQAQMPPTWIRRGGRLNAIYNIPDRVNKVEMYPATAPNGSSIVVYGHDNGLSCLWQSSPRQGNLRTQFDNPFHDMESDRQNISLTHGAEDTIPKSLPSIQDRLHDQVARPDHIQQYDTWTDILNINLETSVLDIASSPIPTNFNTAGEGSMPPILRQRLSVVVACADGTVRLISAPMSSPGLSQQSRGPVSTAENDVTSLLIGPPSSSTPGIIRGVSMTWTSTVTNSQNQAQLDEQNASKTWRFLIAYNVISSSRQLRIVEVAMNEKGTEFLNPPKLLRLEYLASAGRSLSFNPSVFPAEGHSQLLVVDVLGVLRIYDALASDAGVPDSSPARSSGTWLVSFQVPFGQQSSGAKYAPPGDSRLEILDAQWAFEGRCIVALLGDGQWGVWDVGGFASRTWSGKGDLTRFAIHGHVGNTQASQPSLLEISSKAKRQSENANLVPMTPKTRRAKQESLFAGDPQPPSQISRHRVGGISLSIVHNALIDLQDESLLVWYNSKILAIPSLLSYWSNMANGTTEIVGNGTRKNQTTPVSFPIQDFMGHSSGDEMVIKVSLPRHISPSSSEPFPSQLLLCTESRLTVSSLIKNPASVDTLASLFNHPEESNDRQVARDLRPGSLFPVEVDLHTMDAMLDRMSRSAKEPRRVGFASAEKVS